MAILTYAVRPWRKHRPNSTWRFRRDGVPPDMDERTYRWDNKQRRWIALDEPDIDEDALEEWEHRRRERLAIANEY